MTQVLDRYNYNGERIEVTKLNPGEYLVTFGLNPDGTEHDPKCVGPFLYHEDAISAVYERRPGVKRCNRMCNNCTKNCVGETRTFYSGCVFKKTR